MDFEKVSGVKISPSLIEFYDAEPNIVHRMKISIQNLDKVSKHVKILSPTTEVYTFYLILITPFGMILQYRQAVEKNN